MDEWKNHRHATRPGALVRLMRLFSWGIRLQLMIDESFFFVSSRFRCSGQLRWRRFELWRTEYSTDLSSVFPLKRRRVDFSSPEGKCGVCGDAFNGPRDHEAGGKYATNMVVRHYVTGALVDVKILVNRTHRFAGTTIDDRILDHGESRRIHGTSSMSGVRSQCRSDPRLFGWECPSYRRLRTTISCRRRNGYCCLEVRWSLALLSLHCQVCHSIRHQSSSTRAHLLHSLCSPMALSRGKQLGHRSDHRPIVSRLWPSGRILQVNSFLFFVSRRIRFVSVLVARTSASLLAISSPPKNIRSIFRLLVWSVVVRQQRWWMWSIRTARWTTWITTRNFCIVIRRMKFSNRWLASRNGVGNCVDTNVHRVYAFVWIFPNCRRSVPFLYYEKTPRISSPCLSSSFCLVCSSLRFLLQTMSTSSNLPRYIARKSTVSRSLPAKPPLVVERSFFILPDIETEEVIMLDDQEEIVAGLIDDLLTRIDSELQMSFQSEMSVDSDEEEPSSCRCTCSCHQNLNGTNRSDHLDDLLRFEQALEHTRQEEQAQRTKKNTQLLQLLKEQHGDLMTFYLKQIRIQKIDREQQTSPIAQRHFQGQTDSVAPVPPVVVRPPVRPPTSPRSFSNPFLTPISTIGPSLQQLIPCLTTVPRSITRPTTTMSRSQDVVDLTEEDEDLNEEDPQRRKSTQRSAAPCQVGRSTATMGHLEDESI